MSASVKTWHDDSLLRDLRRLVEAAGEATLAIYHRGDFDVEHKGDDSPVTEADLESQRILVSGLRRLDPAIPIIAEESEAAPWSERRAWERAFLVDPLDGTREFVKKPGAGGRGEFTINVALVESGAPVAGAVCAPVLGRTYLGRVASGATGGAWRLDHRDGLAAGGEVAETLLGVVEPPDPERPRVVASRSHRSAGVDAFLGHLGDHGLVSMGSSLKLCVLAEGGADLYPRLGRTMEWDIAAGHAVLRAAGGHVIDGDEEPLRYNEEDLSNPDFLALGAASPEIWRRPWRRVVEEGGRAITALVTLFASLLPLAFVLACFVAAEDAAAQGLASELELVEVATGFDQPVDLRHAGDGSGRLFVVERSGTIRVLEADGTVLPDPFLDLSGDPVNTTGGEMGLLGLAFHPEYATNGLFFVYYAHSDPELESVIERYSVSAGDPDAASEASLLRILAFPQEFANHNGGGLHFGPDGYLYLASGDGGGAGDPLEHAQNLGTLLGTILRLDVDGGVPYAIPPDNPFVGVEGAREEIWAYGLRNPWRASFDRLTGDLWIGDVGQGAVEEIDFYPAMAAGGRNYGWDCYEGDDPYQPPSDDEPTVCNGPVHFPLLSHAHAADSEVCSVTGGFRYRGSRIAGLWGVYLYADFCSDVIWLARRGADGAWSSEEWTGHPATSIVSFGEDEAGEIYVVTLGGTIYRVASPEALFFDGFEWGDTRSWSAEVP